jgi:hypothetical protein
MCLDNKRCHEQIWISSVKGNWRISLQINAKDNLSKMQYIYQSKDNVLSHIILQSFNLLLPLSRGTAGLVKWFVAMCSCVFKWEVFLQGPLC